MQSGHVSLLLRSVIRGDRSLDCVVGQAQIVEDLVFEALVLNEGSHDLGGHDVQDRLQEVEEADVGILVRVQQVHVIDSLELLVLPREVELLANQQYCTAKRKHSLLDNIRNISGNQYPLRLPTTYSP